ncbi:DUF5131 family protein [Nonomuraea dietziae]|uniref:DUF5131 family protein n=1 Tax=Nonomuraea dietziae TaxID=65515 RepID=UPI0033E777D1
MADTKTERIAATWHPLKDLDAPLRWQEARHAEVVDDLFQDQVPDAVISRVFAVMAATEHTYQVRTEQHDRMHALLACPEFADRVRDESVGWYGAALRTDWPLPNVRLGVSEDQTQGGPG